MKICVIIGSRANWGRLKKACQEIQKHPKLTLQLIIGASALNCPINFPVDAKVQCLVDYDDVQSMTITTGLFLTKLGSELERLNPDIVLIHGDRYEMLAAAICASYMNIPLAHTEGGELTGTIDDKVRDAITTLADIHFPVTEKSADRVRKILKNPKHVYTIGSTAIDNLVEFDQLNNRTEPYIVILQHPDTTNPEPIEPLIEAVKQLPLHKVWVNPNVDAGAKQMLKQIHKQPVEFVKNLPPDEYYRLIRNAECLIGNTSSGIKEGAYLSVPYVCVGDRQKKREIGHNTVRVRNTVNDIVKATNRILGKSIRPMQDLRFGDGTASKKLVNILVGIK